MQDRSMLLDTAASDVMTLEYAPTIFFRFLMFLMFAAIGAVFVDAQSFRIIFLVFHACVIASFAFAAS